ncbi:phage tail protein [Clavibacter michiganensis]|uniref:phage tail protein n=1 Tax=Clavibacter michiganensis TaxID=28447 RepID=UPI001C64617C|nr:hypothetical protein [Clavibacter michiganensis]
MSSEVGSGQVAIFPTFKGFRQKTSSEVDGAAKEAGGLFSRVFSKSGSDAGQAAGKGFRSSFGNAAGGAATQTVKQINTEIASASKALSAARLKEQDSAGKVRVAEVQLAEARKKGGDDTSRVVAAEEKLASAQRGLVTTQASVKSSTDRLATARKQLADASEEASRSETKSSKSSSGFGASLKAAFTRDLAAAGDSGGKESGRRAGEGLRTGILGAVGSLAAPLAAVVAGLGIGRMLASSITNASDFQESATAITAVFGDADKTIQDFAANSATSLGQSKNQTLDAARTFGVFGKAAGLSGGELAGFSTDFITLAADLASFNNTTPEEAIEALGAGLRGESEPLRAYGILLDDATLKARATKMGIYSGNDALTQQQKVLASQGEIMAQTSTQQGDFARTSQGLANQQRILKAQTENLSTSFGMLFLPIVLKVVGALNTTLVPALFAGVDAITAVYDGFRDGKTALDLGDKTAGLVSFGVTLRGFADQVGVIFGDVKAKIASAFSGDGSQLSTLIGQVVGFVSALSPLQLVFSAIAPLLPTLLSLSGQVAGALTAVLGAALQVLTPILQNLVEDLVGLAGFMGRNTELVGTFAAAILAGVVALKIYRLTMVAVAAVTKAWAIATKALAVVQAGFNLIALANPVAILVVAIAALIAGIVYLATQTTFFQDLWTNVASFFSTLWQATQLIFETVINAIVSFLTGQLLFIQSTWNAIWTGISSFFTGLWNGLVAFVQTVLVALATMILIQVTAVQTIWNTVWQAIGDFLSGIWNAIVTTVTTNFQNMVALAQERLAALAAGWNAVWSAVLGFLSAVWNGIVSVVTTVFGAVQGFIVGALTSITGFWVSTWSSILSFFSGIWNGILSFVLGVASSVVGAVAGIVNSVRSKVGEAVAFVSGLPGQAMAALGNLGSKLFDSGKSLIQGFINGIKDMVGAVGRAVSNVVQGALDFFPNSPAKKGPLMGPGWRKLRRSGQAVTDQFADGFDPDVFDFGGGFPGNPGPTPGGGDGGGSGGGGGMQVIFNGPVTTQDVPELIKAQRREATRARKAALGGARRVRVAA